LLTDLANNTSLAAQSSIANALSDNLSVRGGTGNTSAEQGNAAGQIAIVDGSIVADDLGSNSVTTAKIADGAVTFDKLGSDVQKRVTTLESDLNTANSGIAMAYAMTNIPSISSPDSNYSFGVGLGTFEGETAIALGGTARISDRANIRASVSSSGDTFGAGIGLAFDF
jgi:hypothetical protein